MTKKALQREYAGAKAIATMGLNNWGGIEILDIIYGINDTVIVRDMDDSLHSLKLKYNTNGGYFDLTGNRYYMSQFMVVR